MLVARPQRLASEGEAVLFSILKKRSRESGTVGVSVAGAALALVRVSREGARPRVEMCVCEAESGGAALAEHVRRHNLGGVTAVSVMPPEDFNLLLVEAPEVEASELKAAVRWRVKDMLDFHIDDAVIDVFDIAGQRERGRPRMMYVVAARIAAVQKHIERLEGAGLDLQAIDIPELSQRNIAALLPEDERGVAVLSFAPGHGMITLTRQGCLYLARTLDVGSAQLSRRGAAAVVEAGAGALAVELQLEEGATGDTRVLDSIVLEVQRSLDYYESHFSQAPIGNLVIAPLPEEAVGLAQYLRSSLGIAVRELDLNEVVDAGEAFSASLQAGCWMALGAALRMETRAL